MFACSRLLDSSVQMGFWWNPVWLSSPWSMFEWNHHSTRIKPLSLKQTLWFKVLNTVSQQQSDWMNCAPSSKNKSGRIMWHHEFICRRRRSIPTTRSRRPAWVRRRSVSICWSTIAIQKAFGGLWKRASCWSILFDVLWVERRIDASLKMHHIAPYVCDSQALPF